MIRRDILKSAGGILLLTGAYRLTYAQSRNSLKDSIEDELISLREKVERSKSEVEQMSILKKAVVESNDAAALHKMKNLAERHNLSAMVFMGCVYDQGLGGVKQDSYRGAQYFHAAAKLGENLSLHNLGLIFLQGRGVKANEQVALNYLQLASRSHVKHSNIVLGRHYEQKKDYYNARNFYSLSSGYRTHDEATFKMGIYVFRGISGERKPREGLLLLERASETWHPQAMMALIEIYANGLLGSPNPAEATKWLEILARNPRPYDKRLAASIFPRNTLNEFEMHEIMKSVQIWLNAHPIPTAITDYNKTIWEYS